MEKLQRIREAEKLIRYHRELLEKLRDHPDSARAAELLRWYEGPVNRAVEDLRPSASSLRWIFTGRERRARAYSAFHYLYDVMTLGLGPEAEQIL